MKSLLASVCLVLPTAAFAAGSWTNVSVIAITAYSAESPYGPNGGAIAVLSSAHGGTPPGCATNTTYIAVDTTNNAGMAALSLLEEAMTQGLHVNIAGTGSCSIGPTEALSSVSLL